MPFATTRVFANWCASSKIGKPPPVRCPGPAVFLQLTTDYGPRPMTIPLPQGTGPLYTDPSADHARAFFASKPRAMVDKVASVKDAVARLVHDGDYLAIGGFGSD